MHHVKKSPKQGIRIVLQLHFEVDASLNVSNVNDIRIYNSSINMDENDDLCVCLLIQLRIFFKDMLSGNNEKTEETFIDSGSEPVHWMNLKDAKKWPKRVG